MDELSQLTTQLVRLCKAHLRKSLALGSVIAAIMRDNSQGRAALPQSRIQEMISGADQSASQIVSNEFARLEQALLDGAEFLPALREYLDRNL